MQVDLSKNDLYSVIEALRYALRQSDKDQNGHHYIDKVAIEIAVAIMLAELRQEQIRGGGK